MLRAEKYETSSFVSKEGNLQHSLQATLVNVKLLSAHNYSFPGMCSGKKWFMANQPANSAFLVLLQKLCVFVHVCVCECGKQTVRVSWELRVL